MKETDILEIIKAGEGTTTEFKQQLNVSSGSEKGEFAKDLSAIANTVSRKGYIIYGVTEDKKIVGIRRKRGTDELLIQIASSRIEPPVDFEPIWLEIEGVSVLTLETPKSRKRPHWITNSRDVFIRRNKVVEKAHPNEILAMKSDMNLEDLDEPTEEATNRYSAPTDDRLDFSFFMIGGTPTHYRTCKKSGPFSNGFSPVVFDPQFDNFVPTPEFGDTKSAISFETYVASHTIPKDDFHLFLKNLEQDIPRVATYAQIWDRRFPMYWSLSRDDDMDYGVGAESASLAIHEKEEGVLACVIHFSRINVYKPTCLLLLYADFRPGHTDDFVRLDDCWMKMLTSSLPFNPKWVQDVFQVFQGINESFKADTEISDAVMEKVYTVEWVTARKSRIRSRIFGFMGRERGDDPRYDQSLGLVVDMAPFRNAKMVKDEGGTWNFNAFRGLYDEPPVKFFEEIPVSVTNPVPNWLDIQSGYGGFGHLRTRQIVIGASGRIMSIIGGHSAGVHIR